MFLFRIELRFFMFIDLEMQSMKIIQFCYLLELQSMQTQRQEATNILCLAIQRVTWFISQLNRARVPFFCQMHIEHCGIFGEDYISVDWKSLASAEKNQRF